MAIHHLEDKTQRAVYRALLEAVKAVKPTAASEGMDAFFEDVFTFLEENTAPRFLSSAERYTLLQDIEASQGMALMSVLMTAWNDILIDGRDPQTVGTLEDVLEYCSTH